MLATDFKDSVTKTLSSTLLSPLLPINNWRQQFVKIRLFREEVIQTFHKMLCKDAWRKIFDNIESSFNQAELREQNAINL